MDDLRPVTHYEAIRDLTAIIRDDPKEMAYRIALCNLVARDALGLAEPETVAEYMARIGVRLVAKHTDDEESKA
jgi:hypothetical protein